MLRFLLFVTGVLWIYFCYMIFNAYQLKNPDFLSQKVGGIPVFPILCGVQLSSMLLSGIRAYFLGRSVAGWGIAGLCCPFFTPFLLIFLGVSNMQKLEETGDSQSLVRIIRYHTAPQVRVKAIDALIRYSKKPITDLKKSNLAMEALYKLVQRQDKMLNILIAERFCHLFREPIEPDGHGVWVITAILPKIETSNPEARVWQVVAEKKWEVAFSFGEIAVSPLCWSFYLCVWQITTSPWQETYKYKSNLLAIAQLLVKIKDSRTIEALRNGIQHIVTHKEYKIRGASLPLIEIFSQINPQFSRETLVKLLNEEGILADDAWKMLATIGAFSAENIEPLYTAVKGCSSSIRKRLIDGFKQTNDTRMVEPLCVILKNDPDKDVRIAAAQVLGQINDAQMVEPLCVVLKKDADNGVRIAVAKALGQTNDARMVEPLCAILKDNPNVYVCKATVDALSMYVRNATIEALGQMANERVIAPLCKVLEGCVNNRRFSYIKTSESEVAFEVFSTVSQILERLTLPDNPTIQAWVAVGIKKWDRVVSFGVTGIETLCAYINFMDYKADRNAVTILQGVVEQQPLSETLKSTISATIHTYEDRAKQEHARQEKEANDRRGSSGMSIDDLGQLEEERLYYAKTSHGQ